jgi:hypothetical protein
MLNNDQRRSSGLGWPYEAQRLRTAPAAASRAPLRPITAYNGWLILEYSERVQGKPNPRFAVQHPPDGTIQAGNSLNEAKRAIDGHPKSRMKRLR